MAEIVIPVRIPSTFYKKETTDEIQKSCREYFRMRWITANKTFNLLKKLMTRKNNSCKKEIYTVFLEMKF